MNTARRLRLVTLVASLVVALALVAAAQQPTGAGQVLRGQYLVNGVARCGDCHPCLPESAVFLREPTNK